MRHEANVASQRWVAPHDWFGSKAVLLKPSRHLGNLVRSPIDSCRGAVDQPPLTLCASKRLMHCNKPGARLATVRLPCCRDCANSFHVARRYRYAARTLSGIHSLYRWRLAYCGRLTSCTAAASDTPALMARLTAARNSINISRKCATS
jgi:hypothetical protein